jgi:hypothetical protein
MVATQVIMKDRIVDMTYGEYNISASEPGAMKGEKAAPANECK